MIRPAAPGWTSIWSFGSAARTRASGNPSSLRTTFVPCTSAEALWAATGRGTQIDLNGLKRNALRSVWWNLRPEFPTAYGHLARGSRSADSAHKEVGLILSMSGISMMMAKIITISANVTANRLRYDLRSSLACAVGTSPITLTCR